MSLLSVSGPSRPRLIKDSNGRRKLKISLPGGRYQLSLDDAGVNLLCDQLEFDLRNTVPDVAVKVLLATGDAWFPHERDHQSVINDLPETRSATNSELKGLADHLQSVRVQQARMSTLIEVIEASRLSEFLEPSEIEVQELPDVPDGIFEDTETDTTDREVETTVEEEATDTAGESKSIFQSAERVVESLALETGGKKSEIESDVERLVKEEGNLEDIQRVLKYKYDVESDPSIFDIRGVGTFRGYRMMRAGIDSIDELAASRPIDLAEMTYMSEDMATMVIEGARELVGAEDSTTKQLASQTTKPEDEFEGSLNQLAAAGVPPSAAAPTLREIYSPPITAVDGVDGRIAYFLHEAGYSTPWELTQATVDELQEIDYLGSTTAERVIKNARELLNQS